MPCVEILSHSPKFFVQPASIADCHYSPSLSESEREKASPFILMVYSIEGQQLFDRLKAFGRCTIAGMEFMHAIRKGMLMNPGHSLQTPAEQFYALAV